MNSKATNIAIGIFLAFIIVTALAVLMLTGLKGKSADSSEKDTSSAVTTASAAESEQQAEQEETTTTTTTASSDAAATTTTTSITEQEKEYVSYTFRTKKQFDGHFEKHGKEFGSITQEEYLKKANDLINNDSDTILHKTEAEDGDYIFYDTVNNEILFLSADGYIRTYFKPSSGIDYYNRQ